MTYYPGQAINFTASVLGGVAPYSFSWDFGDGATGSGNPASHAFGSVGTYNIVVKIVDVFTNATQGSLPFVVSPFPQLVCSNLTYQVIPEPDKSTYVVGMVSSVTGGNLPYNFVFYWTDGTTSPQGSPVISRYFAPGTQIFVPYQCKVTSADGQDCTSSLPG